MRVVNAGIARTGCAAALAMLLSVPSPQAARPDAITPPPVPPGIPAPAGTEAFLAGHAIGTQNYICLPSAVGFAWTLFGPQATLFGEGGRQIITHFLSPNPDESGLARATWQHSRDTSAVWAFATASSSDPNFVAPGAIPWLILDVVGDEDEPTGSDTLSEATAIHRVNTTGGVAPPTGCTQAADVGSRTFVPYTADYFFYRDED
ncbi:MAG: DUF3455 domain-containing protein [Candidatus Polarisedimenticolia bacterium]